MQENSINLIDKIYAKVMAHVNEFGVDYSHFTQQDAILEFHETFLSNFFTSPVELNSKLYPTVEHAYQAAKFLSINWNTVRKEAKDEIQEALRIKKCEASITYNNDLFTNEKITAGSTKIIADILRKYNYTDKEWENKRVKIMIDLLLQKFRTPEMLSKLKETGEKELVEGNTWNDTLWGISNGKGRNILGIILMEIRKLDSKEEGVS